MMREKQSVLSGSGGEQAMSKLRICFCDADGENGFLSNMYPSEFTVAGKTFTSMEQYVMYHKAECFHDGAIAEEIMKTDDPEKIRELGRMVMGYDDHIWNGIRQLIVYEGLLAKFSQNEDLKGKLKETGNKIIAKCEAGDDVWGTGLSMDDPDCQNIHVWKGQNQLGYTLMMVRERVKEDGNKPGE